jgi:hypothetical protein
MHFQQTWWEGKDRIYMMIDSSKLFWLRRPTVKCILHIFLETTETELGLFWRPVFSVKRGHGAKSAIVWMIPQTGNLMTWRQIGSNYLNIMYMSITCRSSYRQRHQNHDITPHLNLFLTWKALRTSQVETHRRFSVYCYHFEDRFPYQGGSIYSHVIHFTGDLVIICPSDRRHLGDSHVQRRKMRNLIEALRFISVESAPTATLAMRSLQNTLKPLVVWKCRPTLFRSTEMSSKAVFSWNYELRILVKKETWNLDK